VSEFISWLESLSVRDTKVRAILRRSLSFEPGLYPAAFPYVEPFLKGENSVSRRCGYYLFAGLWALHWREGGGKKDSLGLACAIYQVSTKSSSTESRFITLLDSDTDQLPHRLRQIVALLKNQTLDYDLLLKAILHWTSQDRWVQIQWARDFYRHLEIEPNTKPKEQEKSL
jgi:CRISPR system Cascade subunit CasB